MMKQPVVMSYSGGKDSSLALLKLRESSEWEVKRLLTTANKVYDRSSMHGVRTSLFQKQAELIGLPLDVVWMDPADGGQGYMEKMTRQLKSYLSSGFEHMAFGDLYLEDVREYREKMNEKVGLQSLFPVWGLPTKEFALEFNNKGFKAIVVCVDTTQLDASFCGRPFDRQFLEDLPEGIDWCAEKGEFHTFCYDGPIFSSPVLFEIGQQTLRDERFQYVDLLPF